jgi:DNA-binding NtrC family response regulator
MPAALPSFNGPIRVGLDRQRLAARRFNMEKASHCEASFFLEDMSAQLAPGTIARMRQCPWPGSVGELKDYIHRVFIMAGEQGLEGPTLDAEATPVRGVSHASSTPAITVPLGTPLSVAARELILSTLEHCGGERKRTAEMLGICTKTLYNRLREYGIREEQSRTAMGGPPRVS